MIDIDPYRIGYGPFFRIAARWRLHKAGYGWRLTAAAHGSFYRSSSDKWHRNWQAEWTGCQRAVRAYTKRGVTRRALRAVQEPAAAGSTEEADRG